MKSLIRLTFAGFMAAALTISAGATDQRGRRSGSPVSQGQPDAHAEIKDANGRTVGSFEIGSNSGGLIVAVDVNGLPAGRYAVHIHSAGRCDGPDFTSAGGHWNPTNAHHGIEGQGGPHMGDLPNLAVNANGRGWFMDLVGGGARIQGRAGALLDADGASVVIHAGEDDYRTDPSGNSGARIACGVVRIGG